MTFFLGDVHGRFEYVIEAVRRDKPDAVVFLGDVQAQRPLNTELAEFLGKADVWWITSLARCASGEAVPSYSAGNRASSAIRAQALASASMLDVLISAAPVDCAPCGGRCDPP
jgi:hypothetical protein